MNYRNTISEELAGVVATVRGQLARRGWGRPHLQPPRRDMAREPLGALPSHCETCIWKLPGEKKPSS